MKKVLTALTILSLTAAVALPALAADNNLISGAPTVQEALIAPAASSGYHLVVDGKTVEAEPCVMVPLRPVAEALGFTVEWDASLPGARLDNEMMHVDVTLQKDSYTAVSNEAIGMTAPFSLGAAPVSSNGSIYVPVELFRVLLGNRADAITVNGSTISISSKSENTEIANPWNEYETLKELETAMGFAVQAPAAPDGYQLSVIRAITGSMAELHYANGDQTLTYRISQGSGDNSGDYTMYAVTSTITVDGVSVTCKGVDGTVNLATWANDGFSFSVRCASGLTQEQVIQLVESVL